MADHQQQQQQQQQASEHLKSPFSPMQTGCAVVMLTNMLVYLAVVAFTFNLLDPSKIDASYLAKRGFVIRTEEPRREDTAPRQSRTEARQQQQALTVMPVTRREPSPAEKLSTLPTRNLASSRPEEPARPSAALIPGTVQSGKSAIRTASGRRFGYTAFSLRVPNLGYSPIIAPDGRIISPERYDTLPVELASGFDIPKFELPRIDPAAAYLYRPSDPIPQAVRGSPRFSTPDVGAEKKPDSPEAPSDETVKDLP